MNKNLYVATVLVAIVAVFAITVVIINLSTARCIANGCDNEAVQDSNYCYLHSKSEEDYDDPDYSEFYEENQGVIEDDYITETPQEEEKAEVPEITPETYTPKRSSPSTYKSDYDSYDDGYEDIIYDGDYDMDRYESDSDYASGVDDGMEDDEEEDW